MIHVKNSIFQYSDIEKSTLKDINFDIKKSWIFRFLGPNGAGKSTTQKILF